MHPESNVEGKNINFDLDESSNNALAHYFKSQNRNNEEEPL